MEKLDLKENSNTKNVNESSEKKEKKEKKANQQTEKQYSENDDLNYIQSNGTNKANNDLLGKKHPQKEKKPKSEQDKLIKSINKLSMEEGKSKKEKQGNDMDEDDSSSEYDVSSEEEEIYESDASNSDEYEEQEVNKITSSGTNTHKKKEEVTVWDEKNTQVKKDEELVFDNSAYEMLHRSQITWPCYSIDWILPEYFIPQPIKNFYEPIKQKVHEDAFPYSCHFVAGAQTSEGNGILYYMKWFNMHKTLHDEDPDKEADSESEGGEPLMDHIAIDAKGNINKVKTMRGSYITAYWSDQGSIELVDMRSHIETMENRWQDESEQKQKTNNKGKKRKQEQKNSHVKSFKKKQEGFALDWSGHYPGVFAAGGYENDIEIFIPVDEFCSDYTGGETNNYNFRTKFKAHKNGVEGLVFSPSQANLLASSGNDKAVRIWDLRVNNEKEKVVNLENAHKSDVNCIDWKASTGLEMIATGSDDCTVKIWDPRKMSDPNHYIAYIEFHKEPITSLGWDPINPCQLAVTSEDNRLTIWDFAVEPDQSTSRATDTTTKKEIPDQLVFLHQGQENLKDVKFHPYYENFVLSTAENGINVFKPNFNEDEEDEADDFTFNK